MPKPISTRSALAVAILSLGLPLTAIAQGVAGGGTSGGIAPPGKDPSATTRAPDGKPVSPEERQFMLKAATAGQAEIEMARLAQEKATDDQVKKFAEVMVRDHSKTNTELTQLAGEKGVELPSKIEGPHKQQLERFEKLSGPEFDRAYMDLMLEEHKADIQAFERQSKQGNDILLKSFAAKNLLILQQHLKMAQTIDENMKKGAPR